MSGIGFHNCSEHKARQLDDCPYCRIAELEAWQKCVRLWAPEVAQVADEEQMAALGEKT